MSDVIRSLFVLLLFSALLLLGSCGGGNAGLLAGPGAPGDGAQVGDDAPADGVAPGDDTPAAGDDSPAADEEPAGDDTHAEDDAPAAGADAPAGGGAAAKPTQVNSMLLAQPFSGPAPLKVKFQIVVSGGTPKSYRWEADFDGDGQLEILDGPGGDSLELEFKTPGEHKVKVTVKGTDANGNPFERSAEATVEVK